MYFFYKSRDTTTELRTFFRTVPDYDFLRLVNLEYVGFGEYKGKTDWKPSSYYRKPK